MKTDNDMRLDEDVERGVLAHQVLNNPIYQQSLIAIRAQLFSQFEQTKFRDRDERDEAWRKLQAINYIEGYLSRVMQTGQLAERTLAECIKAAGKRLLRA